MSLETLLKGELTMTEMEMIDEARTQWLEVKKILSRWVVRDRQDLEVFMKTSVYFDNVWQPNKSECRFDFDYKKITATVSFENGKMRLGTNVDYWENEEGSVHCFEIKE